MSTYPVDVKAVQKSTAATHTIFAGPGRIVGLYINKVNYKFNNMDLDQALQLKKKLNLWL